MKAKQIDAKGTDVIYILLSKKKRCFFIARGSEETLRETYRHHLKNVGMFL